MTMSDFSDRFDAVITSMGGLDGAQLGADYIERVDADCIEGFQRLCECAEKRKNMPADQLKGFMAETWHSVTLKIEATVKGKTDIWSRVPDDNGKSDILFGDSHTTKEAQVKFYKTPVDTAKQLSDPQYAGMVKIGPADQIEVVRQAAKREALRNANSRPEQAGHYQDTAKRADDRLRIGGAESRPKSELEMKRMTEQGKRGEMDRNALGLNTESSIGLKDVLCESGKAAIHAAVLAAAIKAAPHVWTVAVEYVESGEIDIEDIVDRGKDVLASAKGAGLRGGIAAAITASARAGFLGAQSQKCERPIPSYVNAKSQVM